MMNSIPVKKWGKDHWSTFAYLETCVVDQSGKIQNNKMRCHPRVHRNLVGFAGTIPVDGSKYPTKLKEEEVAERHDDWSCLEDMVSEGIVEIASQERVSEEFFGNTRITVRLTEKGQTVAAALRLHKAGGGQFFEFVYEEKE